MQAFFDTDLVDRFVGHDEVTLDGSGLVDRAWRMANTANCIILDRTRGGAPAVVSVMVEIRDEEHRAALLSTLAADANRLSEERLLQEIGALGQGFVCAQGSTRKIAVMLADRMIRVDLTSPDGSVASSDTAVEFVRNADRNATAFDRANA